MTYTFKLPDVGEGMAEGVIASWLVKVGDTITEGQPLLELENDKLVQEVLSPHTGKITKIMVEAGDTAQVGDPLVIFDGDSTTQEVTPIVSQVKETTETNKLPANVLDIPQSTKPTMAVKAMPSIRQVAHQKGIDLQTIVGTGNRGQITLADLDQTIITPVVNTKEIPVVTPVYQTVGSDRIEKLTSTRKAIANAMSTSKYTIPHVTLFDEVEVSRLIAHRQHFKEIALEKGIKLTYLAYIVKALCATAIKYPVLNSVLNLEQSTLTYRSDLNIGIATDTEKGLIVPNIKQASTKSIFAIAREIQTLAAAAVASHLQASDIQGGTLTISNIGSVGGGWFTPIINFPEVAILGIGRIQQQPIVDETQTIVIGNMLKLSLSFDHRIIDGATAQHIMNELKRLISDPDTLLMEV